MPATEFLAVISSYYFLSFRCVILSVRVNVIVCIFREKLVLVDPFGKKIWQYGIPSYHFIVLFRSLPVQVLERMNKDLEQCSLASAADLRLEQKRAEMLDRRFAELAANHDEMIKIKDEYKAANETLRRENARLQDENDRVFCQALADRDKHILELDEKRAALQKQCAVLEQKYRWAQYRFIRLPLSIWG